MPGNFFIIAYDNKFNPVQLNSMYYSLQNTFQAILATDAINSFSIFYYQNIEWTFGKASNFTSAQVDNKLLKFNNVNSKLE